MPTANEVRQQFLDFFAKKHGHTIVPSSPVVPQDDPTLLFTNAGMNQFKDVFLGAGTRPYKRAVDTQKCIRAGGKHNDLDDVGKDTYHHTFFEMLGNWSFGDYFKKEAIRWAWELLTEVWKLDKSRLHATVFEGSPDEGVPRDEEAYSFWKSETDIDPSHIHFGNKKDNFWEMGETGPCGPCSEIHYDRTPDKSGGKLVNTGSPLVIEIWNLVFIQFNRAADKKLTPLPAKHVDTGMGFERVTAVLQGKESNYDTDVFTPIMKSIGDIMHKKYGGRLDDLDDVAFRVIADHLRMLTFAINDGALPGNKGRGAVLRSVLRRAFRFGYQQFGLREPFIWKLVPALVDHMGAAFPDLRSNPGRLQDIIKAEEADFLRTLEHGLSRFANALVDAVIEQVAIRYGSSGIISVTPSWIQERTWPFNGTWSLKFRTKENRVIELSIPSPSQPDSIKEFVRQHCANPPTIPAKVLFDLHTTYGFPPDMTRQMAQERDLAVDLDGYSVLMREHGNRSRVQSKKNTYEKIIWLGQPQRTDDSAKYKGLNEPVEGLLEWWILDDEARADERVPEEGEIGLVVDKTNFYAEQGGQVGDKGWIESDTGRFRVEKTQRIGDTLVHIGRTFEGHLEISQVVKLTVDESRAHTMRNHTATHLMNWALRKVLGDHIDQKGSLVDPDKTRFDFTHDKALSPEQIAEVERLVNERIYADLPVTDTTMQLAEAKRIPGVRAVFGEKYPDEVRVLMIGVDKPEDATPEQSIEFCGGTHLTHTGQAGFFKIVSQEPVSKGVRRVTAVTGRKAVETVQALSAVVDDLTGTFNCKPEELSARVAALQDEIKKLQQQLKKGVATDLQGAADKLLAAASDVNGAKLLIGEMPAGPAEPMRQQVDRLRQKAGSAVVVLGWPTEDGKVQLMAAVTDDLVKKGLHAGKLVGQVAKVVGGGGGGKPTMAEAGGKDPAKLGEALQLARKLVSEQLAN